jgi:hypothetical protein
VEAPSHVDQTADPLQLLCCGWRFFLEFALTYTVDLAM